MNTKLHYKNSTVWNVELKANTSLVNIQLHFQYIKPAECMGCPPQWVKKIVLIFFLSIDTLCWCTQYKKRKHIQVDKKSKNNFC